MRFELVFLLLLQAGLCKVCWALAPSALNVDNAWRLSIQRGQSSERARLEMFSGFQRRKETCTRKMITTWSLCAVPPPGGIKVETPSNESRKDSEATEKSDVIFQNRGNVNEIDFCMAPSDVSLSLSYGSGEGGNKSGPQEQGKGRILSLTRALNAASNRAIRRILLSRSWPSAEALNESLRQVLASGSSSEGGPREQVSSVVTEAVKSSPKCPVPRPILDIIMRRRGEPSNSIQGRDEGVVPEQDKTAASLSSKRGRTNEEWVKDQIEVFRESYGELPGYKSAEAYLESILSLATIGVESPKVAEVLAEKIYDEPYSRFVSVLKSVGVVFEEVPDSDPPLARIASKLIDRDICLSMLDKMSISKEKLSPLVNEDDSTKKSPEAVGDNTAGHESTATPKVTINTNEKIPPVQVFADEGEAEGSKSNDIEREKYWFMFWRKSKEKNNTSASLTDSSESVADNATSIYTQENQDENAEVSTIKPEDLGGVLLSAEEPTMTRQLNVLSNIVKRTLLFGGGQELLVLSETLDADKPAFIQRWYPETRDQTQNLSISSEKEKRPGVQYYNCLVQLLKDCYEKGEMTDLNPPFPLIQSYANAYERLTCSLVELGSGYAKPISLKRSQMALPKTAQEEFGRFAQWEASVRKSSPDVSAYPDDMMGSYQVKDEVAGKTIGISTVVLGPGGKVLVAPPMQGLRWRLDPGPTHLDTCTFQVLSDDGAVLQYKGFIDRGARLEARFSKRPIVIRGAVTFQMRDGEAAIMGDDYWKDMLPVNVKTETTKFVMTKSPINLEEKK
mmetsp:Transcript_10348/g.13856  ORF Transcript_10348/g.13856 Transcript_10348/m.13856 type:complete len:791 (+) Transcript_10348:206-2578(+)